MCFSEKRNKKNTFKLSSEKNLKNKIFTDKDQIYLISNKEFISRNYKKLQKIKENTSKSKLHILMEKEENSSLKIKSPNKFDRKLLIQIAYFILILQRVIIFTQIKIFILYLCIMKQKKNYIKNI